MFTNQKFIQKKEKNQDLNVGLVWILMIISYFRVTTGLKKMYLNLLFLPFLAFLFIILFSRFVNKKFILLLNIFFLVLAIILSFSCFYEVVMCGSPVTIVFGP
eukprot:TRINITY_DN102_c0_g1_i1.p8 TRINITY_DN102_c0_g1~~TRINITY_DN102_c0_g1_i1.p8  ORF type:complete len:103 (-),score=2.91 TRINITY_DN102_c0_g1_i1:1780-2088(-)